MIEIQMEQISDHETRRSSFQRANEDMSSEDTPLINRFPNSHHRDSSVSTIIIVGFLLGVLLAGLVIGVYLLILQNNSENILPPIQDPISLLSQGVDSTMNELPGFEARNVVVLQTDTRQCDSRTDCIDLLVRDAQMANRTVLYNFFVATNGLIFEELGWKKSQQVYDDLYDVSPLILAFIGNFTDITPSFAQVEAAKSLITNAVKKHHLSPLFKIIGKATKVYPKKLFETLSSLPQWKNVST